MGNVGSTRVAHTLGAAGGWGPGGVVTGITGAILSTTLHNSRAQVATGSATWFGMLQENQADAGTGAGAKGEARVPVGTTPPYGGSTATGWQSTPQKQKPQRQWYINININILIYININININISIVKLIIQVNC